jgi:hypothetical protein
VIGYIFFSQERILNFQPHLAFVEGGILSFLVKELRLYRFFLQGVFRDLREFLAFLLVSILSLTQELAAKGVLIIYVTSTPYQLTPFLLKFLRDNKFPEGPIFTRWLGYGRFSHKWRSIYRLLSNIETQKCVLIGDSGEQDLQIYRRIYETEAFSERVEKILIRHIPGTPLLRTLHDKEAFYNNPDDLRTHFREILEERVLSK